MADPWIVNYSNPHITKSHGAWIDFIHINIVKERWWVGRFLHDEHGIRFAESANIYTDLGLLYSLASEGRIIDTFATLTDTVVHLLPRQSRDLSWRYDGRPQQYKDSKHSNYVHEATGSILKQSLPVSDAKILSGHCIKEIRINLTDKFLRIWGPQQFDCTDGTSVVFEDTDYTDYDGPEFYDLLVRIVDSSKSILDNLRLAVEQMLAAMTSGGEVGRTISKEIVGDDIPKGLEHKRAKVAWPHGRPGNG